jgi:superfamily II DNA or RNA helicase
MILRDEAWQQPPLSDTITFTETRLEIGAIRLKQSTPRILERLWPHQKEAVANGRKYIKASPPSSALVRMPTGTGKTGVMAVLAQYYKDTPIVLIVAPWKHLVKQIAAETSVDFWKKLGIEPPRLKKALALVPVDFDRALGEKPSDEGMIFVCTNQALQKLQAAYANAYQTLKERVALILVDEGHREPAPTWAKAVRDLQKPTVLFTATPYRNDWRLFDLDETFRFAFYHAAAVKGRFRF